MKENGNPYNAIHFNNADFANVPLQIIIIAYMETSGRPGFIKTKRID